MTANGAFSTNTTADGSPLVSRYWMSSPSIGWAVRATSSRATLSRPRTGRGPPTTDLPPPSAHRVTSGASSSISASRSPPNAAATNRSVTSCWTCASTR
ncbi:hypothetical protein ACIBQ6_26225 [Nonomuraea sp. NPDC049655]|uniref:hypothetical protein n=1 Tax=Nonomuraea sp. NPDC049655 TaxID=3364355 RepID=UPI0037921134